MTRSTKAALAFKEKHLAQSVILKEGQYIRLFTKDGWEFVSRKNCTGIVIVLGLTDDHKVILIEQFRIPVGKPVIEFPAGLVNDHGSSHHESILTAARRELLEETGYRAKKIVLVTEGPGSGGSSADIVSLVQAIGLKKVSQGGGIEEEQITVHEVPLTEVDHWLEKKRKAGILIDPKIYAGLYFLKLYEKQTN